MAGKIFINYRRGDDPGFTQALYLRLESEFATGDLFMDVEGHIKPGDDFIEILKAQVAASDVLLAVIGPRWAELLATREGDPDDFVAIEIKAALDQRKRVIPVLVGGASMPRAESLPEAIQPLARRNAVGLRPERFRADCQGLVAALKESLAAAEQERAARTEAQRRAIEAARLEAKAQVAAKARIVEPRRGVGGLRRGVMLGSVTAMLAVLIFGGWLAYLRVRLPLEISTSVPPDISKSVPPAQGELALKPGSTLKECANCPEMVIVPAGSFLMGSNEYSDEKPPHPVTIRQPFAVGKFEVTFDEWDACVAQGGCARKPDDQSWGRGRRPVMNVSWDDAKEYVAWIAKLTGKPYRLLTEAEWEYAARAGTAAAYSWGNDIGAGLANCNGCGSQWDNKQTAPVGSFKPNDFGLYDMHGNVWEWVEDRYHDSYSGAPADGTVWASCTESRRVVRGRAWYGRPGDLRAVNRFRYGSAYRGYNVGFRVAWTLTS